MLVEHRLLLRGTSYQRRACSDPTSCGLSLPFVSHYFPGSYLIPLEPITPRSVLTFEASLEPRGSCYRVFISVGRSQARKFSLGWFPGGRLKPLADPRGVEDSWEDLRYFPENQIKNSHFSPQHPSSRPCALLDCLHHTKSPSDFEPLCFGGSCYSSFSKWEAWTTRRPQGDFNGTGIDIFYFNNRVFTLIFQFVNPSEYRQREGLPGHY